MEKKVTINKDLLREREKCIFNPLELTHLLDGGEEKTTKRRKIEEFFLSDPELRDDVPVRYKSYKEVYENAVRKSCHFYKKIRELQEVMDIDGVDHGEIIGGMLNPALFGEGNPFVLNNIMFIPTLIGQGTPEQQSLWIHRAFSFSLIGTYAQTELGHGTFLRGLETQATYDPATKEFVLNSPTLTSYKWWPGGLGNTANYAIVVAQLNTQGVCRGVHTFIVQLRDEETHEPMPGIKIGDIGSKLASNASNHGFLGLNNVRIPRENMLMKNSQVLEDGTYVKAPSDKLTYGTMTLIRVFLVRGAARYLAKAATIATRYSTVRRQSQLKATEPECQIMDFITQQYKLFPHLAAFFAFNASAAWILDMYHNVFLELDKGVLNRLPELHALACCLKAVATSDASHGIEELRLACGGHGYSDSSNLPTTYGLVTAMCTYEGENTVMLLQTARYLVKSWRQAVKGETLPPTINYLTTFSTKGVRNRPWKNTLSCIIRAHEAVAASKIRLATENMERRIRSGSSLEDAWNETSIELVQAAEAHCRAFIVMKFAETVQSYEVSKELKQVLMQLCELYAAYWVLKKLGDFLQFSSLNNEDVPALQKRLEGLLLAIRPNAVGIVDGFDFSDEMLGSTLGAYDGNVYQRIFDEAMKNPMNHESVNQSFHKYIKPLLKSSL